MYVYSGFYGFSNALMLKRLEKLIKKQLFVLRTERLRRSKKNIPNVNRERKYDHPCHVSVVYFVIKKKCWQLDWDTMRVVLLIILSALSAGSTYTPGTQGRTYILTKALGKIGVFASIRLFPRKFWLRISCENIQLLSGSCLEQGGCSGSESEAETNLRFLEQENTLQPRPQQSRPAWRDWGPDSLSLGDIPLRI